MYFVSLVCSLTDHPVVLRSLSQCHKCPGPHISPVLTAGFPVTTAPYVGFVRHHVPAFILSPWLRVAVCQASDYQSAAASMAATHAVGACHALLKLAPAGGCGCGLVETAISHSPISFLLFSQHCSSVWGKPLLSCKLWCAFRLAKHVRAAVLLNCWPTNWYMYSLSSLATSSASGAPCMMRLETAGTAFHKFCRYSGCSGLCFGFSFSLSDCQRHCVVDWDEIAVKISFSIV